MTNLTDCQRCCIIDELLKLSIDGDLPHGAKIAVARDFKRSPSAIGKIWTHYCISVTAEVEGGEWQSRIKENPGTKRKDRSKCIVRLQELPIEDRSVERRAARLGGVSRHIICSLVAGGKLERKAARIRPTLTQKNKLDRVEHVLIFINDDTLEFEPLTIKPATPRPDEQEVPSEDHVPGSRSPTE
ncbi:hypothetical protein L914_10771, partial [Phytophthora nicotianae]